MICRYERTIFKSSDGFCIFLYVTEDQAVPMEARRNSYQSSKKIHFSANSFEETMEPATVEVKADELVSAFLNCKGKWEQIDPVRTVELLNILIDEKFNDEGGHGYRVVERLVELGFSKRELMVLKFAESDIERALQEDEENV